MTSLLCDDIIWSSKSPWASSVVLMKKKDETLHFCFDYHHLNKIIKKGPSPKDSRCPWSTPQCEILFIYKLQDGLLGNRNRRERLRKDCLYNTRWPLQVEGHALWSLCDTCDILACYGHRASWIEVAHLLRVLGLCRRVFIKLRQASPEPWSLWDLNRGTLSEHASTVDAIEPIQTTHSFNCFWNDNIISQIEIHHSTC